MIFGKVVVGPNSWDVGELLSETGNPVFDPDATDSAVDAIEAAFRMAVENIVGLRYRKVALCELSPEQCSETYLHMFKTLATPAVINRQP